MDEREKTRQYNREYYHRVRKHKKTNEDREKLNEYHKQWRKKNKGKWGRYQICNKYGITEDRYDEMMSAKNCPICGVEFTEKGHGKRNIDHCHDTGIVRGVLCHHCNLALGWFDHNIQRLENAIDWIKQVDS